MIHQFADSLSPNIKYGKLTNNTEIYINEAPQPSFSSTDSKWSEDFSLSSAGMPWAMKNNPIFKDAPRPTFFDRHLLRVNGLPDNLEVPPFTAFLDESQISGIDFNILYKISKVPEEQKTARWPPE